MVPQSSGTVLVLPTVNTEAMSAHLAEISRAIAPVRRGNDPPDHFLIRLILDGAGWHGAAALVIPDNLSLLTLPPYCPEPCIAKNSPPDCFSERSSPVANWLAISVFDTYEAIVEACCKVWNRFADQPEIVTSITSRSWATVT